MLCYTADEDTYFKLMPDRITWEEFKTGGEGGLKAEDIAEPLYINDDGKLSLRESAVLPKINDSNQILVTTNQNTVEWRDRVVSTGQRSTVLFEPPTAIESGETVEFELEMAKSVLLVTTKLSAPGLLIEGFATNLRNDPNPYTFQSTVDYLVDEGIKVEGDNETAVRRYSLMSNKEDPVVNKLYFKLTNKGDLGIIPKVEITYVSLE